MDVHFPTVELDLTQSGLVPFPGCQGSCDIVPNGPAGSVVSFNIFQCLKCYHVASKLNLIIPMLKLNLPWTNFSGVFSQTDVTPAVLPPGPKALCCILKVNNKNKWNSKISE